MKTSASQFALKRLLQGKATYHLLEKDHILIGRHPICDLKLEDTSISNLHINIYHTPNGWYLRHFSSQNGVDVIINSNKITIPPGGQIELELGMTIRLGHEVVFLVTPYDEARQAIDNTETKEVSVLRNLQANSSDDDSMLPPD